MSDFTVLWTLATQHFVTTFVALLVLLAWIYFKNSQPISALTFLGFGAVLAAGEGASIYFTHKTISENHWLLDANDPEIGMTLFLILLFLTLLIVVHLGKITIDRMRNK